MRTIEYTYREADKAEWGEGPWHNEPDKIQWQDEATGLPCLVVRNRFGAWCGYAGVEEGHPLFGVPYNECESRPELDGIYIHGGLTFSDFCVEDGKEHGICHLVEPGENDRVWWFGFDCGHSSDLVPRIMNFDKKYGLPTHGTYKTVEFARAETRDLAAALAGVK